MSLPVLQLDNKHKHNGTKSCTARLLSYRALTCEMLEMSAAREKVQLAAKQRLLHPTATPSNE